MNKYLPTHHNLEHVNHPTLQSSEERINFFSQLAQSQHTISLLTYVIKETMHSQLFFKHWSNERLLIIIIIILCFSKTLPASHIDI